MTPTRRHLAIFLSLAALAGAATHRRSTLEGRIRACKRLCCVECRSVEVRPDPKTGHLFTHTTFELLEDLKGKSEATTVELRLVGGRLGDRATVVEGMPSFERGGEYVLFLGERNAAGFPTLHELRRGVLRLYRDSKDRRFVERAPGAGRRSAASLDAFRKLVRVELKKEAEERRKAGAREESGR